MKKTLSILCFLSILITACNMPTSPVIETQNGTESAVPEVQNTPQNAQPLDNTPLPDEITVPLVDSPSIIFLNMLDETFGWGVTETQIIRTNDGGVTWYNVTPAGLTEAGYGIESDFFDITHAWIQFPDPNNYPNGGTLYHTSDGGITWTSNTTPFSGGDIAFVDANNGWVMADLGAGAGSMAVSVFQTKDGGATWKRTYTNDPNIEGVSDTLPLGGIKYSIVPLNTLTAWIGGVTYSTGTVYLFRTDDGGKTWFKVNLKLSPEAQNGDLSVDKMEFVSSTEGILSLRIGGDSMQTVIYSTNDGGNTWSLAPAKLPSAGTLEIVSARGMIFYGNNQFYTTQDAAKTWKIIPPNVAFGESLTNMTFANSSTGWVITSDSSDHRALYKTTDGGATWSPIIP
jgi:photosystem II stability/assembly factor-like uncharacterized protein